VQRKAGPSHSTHTDAAGKPHCPHANCGASLFASNATVRVGNAIGNGTTSDKSRIVVLPKSWWCSMRTPGLNTLPAWMRIDCGRGADENIPNIGSGGVDAYRVRPTTNSLRCPQHSSHVARRTASTSLSFASTATPRNSQ